MAGETTGVTTGGIASRPLPEAGWVRFRAVSHAGLGVVAELDSDASPTTSGYASHAIQGRTGKSAIAGRSSRDPLRVTFSLLFEVDPRAGSVEDAIRVLEKLHGLSDGDSASTPTMIIEGVGVPHSYSRNAALRWEFDGDPQWGETRYRGLGDGHRCYQQVTVSAIVVDTASTTAEGAAGKVRDHFTVPKAGQPRTLRRIAKRYHTTARALHELNPKLPADPDRPLPPGTKVRVS